MPVGTPGTTSPELKHENISPVVGIRVQGVGCGVWGLFQGLGRRVWGVGWGPALKHENISPVAGFGL